VALGGHLAPAIDGLAADPALSPEQSPPPRAPVFLLHGRDDNVIPSSETTALAAHFRRQGVEVRALLTPVLSHVGIQREFGIRDYWALTSFWRAWQGRLDDD
jgi:predicted esterase